MTLFNIGVGIGFAILALIPFLLMRKRWHLLAVFAISLGFGLVGYVISKNYIYPQYLGWEFEQQIRKQPLFALIEKHHPQEFKDFIAKVRKSLSNKEGLDKISVFSTDLTNRIFYQHLQTAPDGDIYLYLKSTLDLYRYLFVIDPRAVVKLENGDDSIQVDLPAFWEDKAFQSLLNQVLVSKQKVIEGSIKTPAALPTEEMTTPILNNVLDDLIGKYGKDVVRAVFTPMDVKIPPKLAAAVIIDFYASIIGAGEEKAGIVMRHIADLKMKSAMGNQNVIQPPQIPAPSLTIEPTVPQNKELPESPTSSKEGEISVPPVPDAMPKEGELPPPPTPPEPPSPPKDEEIPLPPTPPKPGEPPLPKTKEIPVLPKPNDVNQDIAPPKRTKDIETPLIPKDVELPKPPKEVVLPKPAKDLKTP